MSIGGGAGCDVGLSRGATCRCHYWKVADVNGVRGMKGRNG